MSNTNENDKHVEITIEEAAGNSIGNEVDTKPTATVVPVVPEPVNVPKEEARPPKSNSGGNRGRQLKPDSNGTRSRSGSVSVIEEGLCWVESTVCVIRVRNAVYPRVWYIL